ncbi:MAG: glycoside hydrolase family 99-like domain-containing protein [Lacunisphaera sp.]
MPVPEPVDTGRYLVGAVMCPLWNDGKRWTEIEPYPDRKPLLGWYDEGDPEVTDWEIKWALDHGITFFLACWYREPGSTAEAVVRPGLDHWIKSLPRSRYHDQVKFAIMWENANKFYSAPTNEEDFLGKLVPFWIENYFRRPDYLLIDGKPVFSIFSPATFIRELGGEAQAAAALAKMRLACVQAGFPGVHILGQSCWGKPAELAEQAAQIQRLGLDNSWAYHWPTFTGAFGGNPKPSGAEAIAAQEKLWQTQRQPNLLTLSMGWDEAPWHFKYSKAQWRLTPAEFKTLAQKAKAVMDQRTGGGLESKIVLLDNWNEFGEGHYIFPTQEHGFGYLDAIREVFAPDAPRHTDLTPEEIGRGPYDRVYRAWVRDHPAPPAK